MKFVTILFFILFSVVALGQEEFALHQFYGKELGFTKGSFRSDSIRIEVLEKVDTAGIMYSQEKKDKYFEYYRTTSFSLDSNGIVKNYREYIYCPVGEWLPTLLEFVIKDDKIFTLVKYNFWGQGKESRIKKWFWDFEIISSTEILLVRNEQKTNAYKH
ncbi:MAG: hypothetical protein AB8B72_08575 [Crocinitomicaceae bacterium]